MALFDQIFSRFCIVIYILAIEIASGAHQIVNPGADSIIAPDNIVMPFVEFDVPLVFSRGIAVVGQDKARHPQDKDKTTTRQDKTTTTQPQGNHNTRQDKIQKKQLQDWVGLR